MTGVFTEYISDFYHFLKAEGTTSRNAIKNYISWLKFLDKFHDLGVELTDSRIDEILDLEKASQHQRGIYTTHRDLSNFGSSLRKLRSFVGSTFYEGREKSEAEEVRRISRSRSLDTTVKERLVKARVGQGYFRESLIRYWKGCAISASCKIDMLVASHIKPWRRSSNDERLDCFNGILLLPNFDRLFDKGYISFDDQGGIIISQLLQASEFQNFGITRDLTLVKIDKQHREYLDYHRKNCFIKL